MSTIITGVVTNGVVVPNSPLPDGARVELQINPSPAAPLAPYTQGELRKLPRQERQAILALAAALAEEDYRDDKELTGFDAFSEEEVDDAESLSRPPIPSGTGSAAATSETLQKSFQARQKLINLLTRIMSRKHSKKLPPEYRQAENPVRGEVWQIRFDPADGDEIKKVRTAVVVSENAVGRLPLTIVVPITEWKPKYANYPWFVQLPPTPANGLTKDSGADAFQVKSVSETRFLDRLGELTSVQLDDIANAIATCVGAP
jgi:mRNA interferase MazF